MCGLIDWNSKGFVADLKHKYVRNIAESAKDCKNISRIVLFGSATQTRCTERSDIDIAVFGDKPQHEYLRSEEFKRFQRRLFAFENDYKQDYDILYFREHGRNDSAIMADIASGTEIYRRS